MVVVNYAINNLVDNWQVMRGDFINFNNPKISGVDSCGGDSGGPLVYRAIADDPYYQVGIVSYGTKICGQGIPGVYTRVTSFLDWIQSKLRE